jgi:hypothetical protein
MTTVGKRFARPPAGFARSVADALESGRPPARRSIGPDAWLINVASRVLPARALSSAIRLTTTRLPWHRLPRRRRGRA